MLNIIRQKLKEIDSTVFYNKHKQLLCNENCSLKEFLEILNSFFSSSSLFSFMKTNRHKLNIKDFLINLTYLLNIKESLKEDFLIYDYLINNPYICIELKTDKNIIHYKLENIKVFDLDNSKYLINIYKYILNKKNFLSEGKKINSFKIKGTIFGDIEILVNK